jgi:hypothetical protein
MGIRRKAGQNQIYIDIYFFYHPIFSFLLPVTISSISSISVYLFHCTYVLSPLSQRTCSMT